MSNNRITSYFGSVPKICKIQSNEDKCVDGVKRIELSETNTISNPTDVNFSGASEFISFEPRETDKPNDCESDTGHFITRSLKSVVLQQSNIPCSDFQYPFLIHTKKRKLEKRFLRKNHFEKFPWVKFSKIKSGLFCKICVLFST